MGNAASVSPGDGALDGKVDVKVSKKDGVDAPAKKKKKKKKAQEPNMVDGDMNAFNASPAKSSSNLDDDDIKPVDLLLQYIPYSIYYLSCHVLNVWI